MVDMGQMLAVALRAADPNAVMDTGEDGRTIIRGRFDLARVAGAFSIGLHRSEGASLVGAGVDVAAIEDEIRALLAPLK